MNRSISALSRAKRFLFSSYMLPAVENNRSDAIYVGEGARYRLAICDSCGNDPSTIGKSWLSEME